MVTETERYATVIDYWRKEGNALCFSISGGMYQQPGIPDCYVACPKFIGWIEFKGAKTPLRPLQRAIIKKLKAQKVSVYVVRFVTDDEWWIMDEDDNTLVRVLGKTLKDKSLRLLEGFKVLETSGVLDKKLPDTGDC